MIEYSQPNTHKAFHVGHMRNCALGDSLVRFYEKLGHHVVATNYLGDEGAHVAKCVWLLEKAVTESELEAVPEELRGEFLGAIYTKAVELLDAGSLTCAPCAGIKGVVTAKVLSKTPHPSEPTWNVVEVSTPQGVHSVVCAGTGYTEGDVVAYTPVGGSVKGKAVVPKDMKGTESCGIIMGTTELGSVPHFPASRSDSTAEEKSEPAPTKKSKKAKKKQGKGAKKQIYVLPADTPLGVSLPEFGRRTEKIDLMVAHLQSSAGPVPLAELASTCGAPLTPVTVANLAACAAMQVDAKTQTARFTKVKSTSENWKIAKTSNIAQTNGNLSKKQKRRDNK
eukprot:100379_1